MTSSYLPLLPRLTRFAAGIIGAFGVAFSALAAHGGDTRLYGAAALISLTQAPALLAISIGWDRLRLAPLASLLIGLGCVLFAGDVAILAHFGHGMFPMAAPTGGTMMIAGWLVIAMGALLRHR